MKKHKYLVYVGTITVGLLVLALLYNFFNMYSLVGKCADEISREQCQAYDNWVMLNEIGLIVLVIGVSVVAIGLTKQRQDKSN